MDIPLLSPVTRRFDDRSTAKRFAFTFYCDLCGGAWRSARYPFNPGTLAAPIDPAIYQILWNDQHRAAWARANRDASFAFNGCPVCGRRVCEACFHLSEIGRSDLCKACLDQYST